MAIGITPTPFETGFRLIDGNDLNTQFGHPRLSSQTGITATASGGQTNAFALTTRVNNVTTVASANDSIRLPASPLGKVVWVMNNGSNSMQVYGAGTNTINGIATATGLPQPAGSLVAYVGITTTDWRADEAEAGLFTSIVLQGSSSGTTTLRASAAAGTTTQTLPAVSGVVASTSGTNLFIADVTRCGTQVDNTGTTLANITNLAQVVVVGTYRFRAVLKTTAGGTGGFKIAFNYTTAVLSAIDATAYGYTATAIATAGTTTTTTQTSIISTATAYTSIILEGTMVVTTGGTVDLQMAENNANSTSSVLVGSTMEFVRIA